MANYPRLHACLLFMNIGICVCNKDRASGSSNIFLCPFLFYMLSPLPMSLPQVSPITPSPCTLTIKKADKIYSPKKYKNRKQEVGYKFKSRQLILNYNTIFSSVQSK